MNEIKKIIKKKLSGEKLTKAEVSFVVKGYSNNQISEGNMESLVRAFVKEGMSKEEMVDFFDTTFALAKKINLQPIPGFKVDKHSTGGVGDKVSLILIPVLAALDLKVFKMSGGRLGFTGGTIEKLSTFPGIDLEINLQTFLERAHREKIVVSAVTNDISNFEKKLYKLRSRIQSINVLGMIVNSIMIKKMVLKNDGIILDVTVGNGSIFTTGKNFDTDLKRAKTFVNWAIEIAKKYDRKTVAVLTRMDQPLGKTVGNKLEVVEALEALSGRWEPDLAEVVTKLGVEVLLMSGKFNNIQECELAIKKVIKNGKAFNQFKEWVTSFGGDFEFVNQKRKIQTKYVLKIKAWKDGFINFNAKEIGVFANWNSLENEKINYEAGLMFHKKKGDIVKKEEVILTVFTDRKKHQEIQDKLKLIIQIEDVCPKTEKVILDVVRSH